jgi:hypothetical protein
MVNFVLPRDAFHPMVNIILTATAADWRGHDDCSGSDAMLDTIILLTSAIERPIFTSVLRVHNPRLTILPVATLAELNALEPELLARARLIAYTTGIIVPADVLGQLGYGAYNFHPGRRTIPAGRRHISRFTGAPPHSARPRMRWSPGSMQDRSSA